MVLWRASATGRSDVVALMLDAVASVYVRVLRDVCTGAMMHEFLRALR